MKLLTGEEMREMDRVAIEEIGLPGSVLMENAGREAAQQLVRHFGGAFPGPVLVLSGRGNNGGDGYVVARHLLDSGWQVVTVVLGERPAIGGDAAIYLEALIRCGGSVHFVADRQALADRVEAAPAALIVDALLGTGISSEVKGLYGAAIEAINRSGAKVAAIDLPSGIDASSGRVLGRAVRADLTVTFACAKVGHASYPGNGYCGKLEVADIGIPAQVASRFGGSHFLIEAAEARALLPPRPVQGHKGTFGHLLVVAGSPGKSGAAAMTAEAGLRSGAGLVTAACPAAIHATMETKLTEAMTLPLCEVDGALSLQAFEEIEAAWADKQALAIGPGLGMAEETTGLVRRLVRDCPKPLVVDADGLNALAGHLDCLAGRGDLETVLTPHPGEMARLTGLSVAAVEADRVEVARKFAAEHRVTLVLKGARTVIASREGSIFVNGSGNPGLASGGMGDLLTGLIAGFICQRLPAAKAACLGTFLHGLAADYLAKEMGEAGLIAGDLLRVLPRVRHLLQTKGV